MRNFTRFQKIIVLICLLVSFHSKAQAPDVDEAYSKLSAAGLENFDKKLEVMTFINIYMQGIFDARMKLRDINECCYRSFMKDFKDYPLVQSGKLCSENEYGDSWLNYFMSMYQRKEFEIHEEIRVALRKVAYQACPKVNLFMNLRFFK